MATNEGYLNTILAALGNSSVPLPGILYRQPAADAQGMLIEPLSERELEVLQLVADGLSNREIAEKLYIPEAPGSR